MALSQYFVNRKLQIQLINKYADQKSNNQFSLSRERTSTGGDHFKKRKGFVKYYILVARIWPGCCGLMLGTGEFFG